MFSDHSKLAVAIVVFYALGLPFAIYLCTRHGFGRHAGWFYLLSMDIVRLVGGCITIAAYAHPSTGLFVAAAIFNSIGLVPLILALMGMMKRVNDGLYGNHIPPRVFQFTHLITLVGLIMSIVAGSESAPGNKPSTLQNAETYRKVAACLLLASAVLNSLTVLRMVTNMKNVQPIDRTIVWCALVSVPFLLVRVAYLMLIGFDKDPKFNPISPNIYVQSFMQILMEFICFALYLLAGLTSPKIDQSSHPGGGPQLLHGKRNQEPVSYTRSDQYHGGQAYSGQTGGVVRNSAV